jgi:hypothetical protein
MSPFLIGTLLLLCALTFYYFAVLKIDYHKTALLDLGPYPDAVEYFAQAKAMLHGEGPSIQIGYDRLPSRYPPGYPALMLPWLRILPEKDGILAPFRTNQTIGLLLLLGLFVAYAYLAMPIAGGFAVLLLATMPGFFTFCRSSMGEITGSAFSVFAFVLVYLGLEEKRRGQIYLAAVLLGLAVNVRIQLVFFGPLLLAMALFPARVPRVRWFLHCFAVLLVFAVAASPVFILNAIQFHSPFRTGYDFWVPIPRLFAFQNVPKHIEMLWAETCGRWQTYRVANIFGTGTYFTAPFVLLACLGFFWIRINRFVICALLAGLSFLTGTALYLFCDGRLYMQLLILLIAVAVLPVEWAVRMFVARKQTVAACAIFGLFLLSCIGFPSQSGFKPKGGRAQMWDALHFCDQPRQSVRFLAAEELVDRIGKQPGIVLSDIDPVYLNALLPEPFVAAPLDGKHDFRFSKLWRYDRPQAAALAKRGLDQSLSVCALFVSPEETTADQSRLPVVPGYEWTVLSNSDARTVILKLAQIAVEDRAPP